jgi:hypothetical protein
MIRTPPSHSLSFLLLLLLLAAVVKQDVSAFLSSSSSSSSSSQTQLMAALNPKQMRVGEIKAELKELRVGCTDCFDKESLVEKLLWARANPRPPPPPSSPPRAAPSPPPPPRPKNAVDFGAESDMNSDIDMDVFAQAGWSADSAKKKGGMGSVDQDRSPGLNRNFDQLGTDDFKKPYY